MKKRVCCYLFASLAVFSSVSVEAGILDNIVMAKVPSRYKKWTITRPLKTYTVDGGYHSSVEVDVPCDDKWDKFGLPIPYGEKKTISRPVWVDTPCEVLLEEFSYIVMEGFRVPEFKLKNGNKRSAYDAVRFGWKVKVKNNSDDSCRFRFCIKFFDSEGFLINQYAELYTDLSLAGGETKVVQEDTQFSLERLKKIARIEYVIEQ